MIFEKYSAILVIIAVLTSLATEGIKIYLNEFNKNYSSNIIAGIVSLIISTIYCCFYLPNGVNDFSNFILNCICISFLSWLCATLGYDKVIQALTQVNKIDK